MLMLWILAFFLKNKYNNTDKSGLEKNRKQLDGKIPSINGLATTAALNGFENKIPNVSDLVKKTNYDAKISDIETKYFTTSDHSKFTGEILNAKINEKGLVDKSDISGFIDKSDLNKKIETLKKSELKAEQDKFINNINFKRFIQDISVVKVILKIMAREIF